MAKFVTESQRLSEIVAKRFEVEPVCEGTRYTFEELDCEDLIKFLGSAQVPEGYQVIEEGRVLIDCKPYLIR